MSKTWLITGSANGLGRAIADAVLARGNNLVATARDTSQLEPLRAAYADHMLVAALDVTDGAAAQAVVEAAQDRFGHLDVLVNNAGFSTTAAFEQTSAEEFDAQIATNFFGVVNLMRAVLPAMRRQRAGHIINVSSACGRIGMPGQSAYCAAKFAVGGLTEALAHEVAGFGVKVIAVEPGSMRTQFGTVTMSRAPIPMADYDDSVGAFLRTLRAINGQEIGDIAKVARVIVDLPDRQQLPTHLILGSDAFTYINHADTHRATQNVEWEQVSRSTDADDADLSRLT
jgi:NAD(P)-dependent dehydrogenase (short-subunit alcohol dehydrogenase family)